MTKRNITRDTVTDMFRKFAGQVNTITIPRPYIDLCGGDHLAALLLSQILYWSDRTDDPDGWFSKSYEQWYEELAMTQYQIVRAINGDKRNKKSIPSLKDFGVESKLLPSKYHRGSPTLHYRVNMKKLESAVLNFVEASVINNVDNGGMNIVDNGVMNNVDNPNTETISETISENTAPPNGAVKSSTPLPKAKTLDQLLYDAIKTVFKTEASGQVVMVRAMMQGKGKRGTWQDCNFNPPVTDPNEILEFKPYMENRMAELKMERPPSAAVTIQRWFYDFRLSQQKKPVAVRTKPIIKDTPPPPTDEERAALIAAVANVRPDWEAETA